MNAPTIEGVRAALVERGRGETLDGSQDFVAEETPVALEYNGVAYAAMLATPCDLEDYAVGFTLSEGIVATAAEVIDAWPDARDEGIVLHIEIPSEREAGLVDRRRVMSGRSGCGMCGLESLAQVNRAVPPVTRRLPAIDLAAIARAGAQLFERQAIHRLTGGVHAAAWAAPDGILRSVREDVGRHNALDKVMGSVLRGGPALESGFLMMSSRASYEIVLKAATLGVELLAAISAPTSLAVQMAGRAGMTLIGFVRGDKCVVYTHPERIATALQASPDTYGYRQPGEDG